MGCDHYYVNDDEMIAFSEVDDTVPCLCTFPHAQIDADTVLSLALLGAAVVLLTHEDIVAPAYLPHAVPVWIRDEIKRNLDVLSVAQNGDECH